ncbi:hypothetical protein [Virgibacillus pantothenticus]|uniref:hypothetical protein n=1 Tax=Virgibacillus pantothenticus TaxID=1473 RepID=UPI00111588A2|nr:hypothetical protein [Virgibacillus pantothenticus]
MGEREGMGEEIGGFSVCLTHIVFMHVSSRKHRHKDKNVPWHHLKMGLVGQGLNELARNE